MSFRFLAGFIFLSNCGPEFGEDPWSSRGVPLVVAMHAPAASTASLQPAPFRLLLHLPGQQRHCHPRHDAVSLVVAVHCFSRARTSSRLLGSPMRVTHRSSSAFINFAGNSSSGGRANTRDLVPAR